MLHLTPCILNATHRISDTRRLIRSSGAAGAAGAANSRWLWECRWRYVRWESEGEWP